MTLPIKTIVRPALVTALILLLPLVAMQSSSDATWDLFDFLVAGTLLFSTGLAVELVMRQANSTAYRLAAGLALGTGLFLVWSNLAVGLIGSENNPANLLYGGVLAVGIIGSIAARLRPRGMARTLFAMALTQLLVPVLALLTWQPLLDIGVVKVFGVNAFFAGLWVGSGLLFRRASASGSSQDRQLA